MNEYSFFLGEWIIHNNFTELIFIATFGKIGREGGCMSGLNGSLARLTASATPLLWEASSDLRQFAVRRWLFRASFRDDSHDMRIQLARLAGAAAAIELNVLSDQARRLRHYLQAHSQSGHELLRVAQQLFHIVLHDASAVALLASSDRAMSWFESGFLEEAEFASQVA